jgi:hypothetical protein
MAESGWQGKALEFPQLGPLYNCADVLPLIDLSAAAVPSFLGEPDGLAVRARVAILLA